MTTKNIANIQNNKLDFYVNSTNRFDVTLRGNRAFSISEDPNVTDNFQIRSAFSTNEFSDISADFLGQISNIDNHSIGNLSNVDLSGISDNKILQWEGAADGEFKAVDANTIGATSFLINAPTTAGENGTNFDLALLTDRVTFSGTDNEINVEFTSNTTNINFSLPTAVTLNDVTIDGDLTVNGTYTIINSEVKLIEDSLITLGYIEDDATPYDIGFRGKRWPYFN